MEIWVARTWRHPPQELQKEHPAPQHFACEPVNPCRAPGCQGQGGNGRWWWFTYFIRMIKALFPARWEPARHTQQVPGRGRVAAWPRGSAGTSVSPPQCGLAGSPSWSDAWVCGGILGGFERRSAGPKGRTCCRESGCCVPHLGVTSWTAGVAMAGSLPGQGSLQKAQQSSGFFLDTLIKL